MKRLILAILILLIVLKGRTMAQEEQGNSSAGIEAPVPPNPVPALQQPIRFSGSPTLRDGTPLRVVLTREIHVKEVESGEVIPFVLESDLRVREVLLARAGAPVEAVIVRAANSKWVSRGSKVALNIKGVQLLNGQQLPLRGTPEYRGGNIGPGGQIAGELVKEGLSCPICEIGLVPVALVSLLLPGTTKNPKANTVVPVWVDGDFHLDLATFQSAQSPGSGKAFVRIARGIYGGFRGRDLYCNGTPLAHLEMNHRIDLELEPGWYRFNINPKKEPFEMFFAAGTRADLITDLDYVYVAGHLNDTSSTGSRDRSERSRERDRKANTSSLSPFSKHKSELEFLEKAHTIEQRDVYQRDCAPLKVEAAEDERD